MNFLNEHARAVHTAPILLAMIESPAKFSELFEQYRAQDGLIDGKFLDQLPLARQVWQRLAEPETVAAILALPLAFREAIFFGLRRDGRADLLAACLENTADKALVKQLKRVLYEMKQEGHEIAERRKKAPLFRKNAESPGEEIPCYISVVDGRNERILILNETVRAGVRTLQVYDREGRAIVHFFSEETSRKKVRAFINDLQQLRQVPLFEIPLAHAQYLLQKLNRRAERAGTAFPAGYVSAISRLKLPEVAERHPYHELVDGQAVMEKLTALQSSGELHREPEFAYWVCDREALLAFQTALQDLETGLLTLSEEQKMEQIEIRLRRTIDQFFTPDRREIYADRLRDAAYQLARRDAPGQAVTAAALALYLEAPDNSPGEVPFFRFMLLKLLPLNPSGAKPPEPESKSGLIL